MDTAPLSAAAFSPAPAGAPRHFLMCAPRYFGVDYVINPWMRQEDPVDRALALSQWEALVRAYREHGHRVEQVEPVAGQPDMVYAANGALVLDGIAYLARFRHPERSGEEPAFAAWFESQGLRVHRAREIHEGEGDFILCGERLLAGTGFRTAREAHAEAAALFDREVLSLELVDPRFYHLDMALCALDAERIMYFPGAFSPASQALLRQGYPDALLAEEADALAFGLNATSDGRRVFIAAAATALAARLRAEGFEPIAVDLSELRRGGGGIKCCTLELRQV
jgi:N-dimethylarginine dimethylaminohydrolase